MCLCLCVCVHVCICAISMRRIRGIHEKKSDKEWKNMQIYITLEQFARQHNFMRWCALVLHDPLELFVFRFLLATLSLSLCVNADHVEVIFSHETLHDPLPI